MQIRRIASFNDRIAVLGGNFLKLPKKRSLAVVTTVSRIAGEPFPAHLARLVNNVFDAQLPGDLLGKTKFASWVNR